MLFSLHPHLGFILVLLAARQISGASLDLLSLHPHLPAANNVQSSLRTEYALTLQVVDACWTTIRYGRCLCDAVSDVVGVYYLMFLAQMVADYIILVGVEPRYPHVGLV